MMDTIVVYHVKTPSIICFDGFCAAALMWRKFENSAEYIPTTYSNILPPERFTGKAVIFVDFSYDVDVMDRIASVAKSLLVLDHHEPRAKSFAGRDYAIFDNTACGALLVWKTFYEDPAVPHMLKVIDDRDRFVGLVEDGDAFHAALSSEPQTFQHWLHLLEVLSLDSPSYNAFIEKGKAILQYEDAKVNSLVKDAFKITLCGMQGLAVNSNKFFSHKVAVRLAEFSGTFGAVFYLRPDGQVETSLRRIKPEIDVEKIAASFGGGGHKGASSFSVSLDKFRELTHPEDRSALFSRIETATKLFQHSYKKPYVDTKHTEEDFLEHLRSELGSFIADDISFQIIETSGHPSINMRLRSFFARIFGLPSTTYDLRWYHKLFPYTEKREFSFDEESIKDVLIESSSISMNSFFIERLLEAVAVKKTFELITSVYYIHITVHLPGTKLTIKHTFEVFK